MRDLLLWRILPQRSRLLSTWLMWWSKLLVVVEPACSSRFRGNQWHLGLHRLRPNRLFGLWRCRGLPTPSSWSWCRPWRCWLQGLVQHPANRRLQLWHRLDHSFIHHSHITFATKPTTTIQEPSTNPLPWSPLWKYWIPHQPKAIWRHSWLWTLIPWHFYNTDRFCYKLILWKTSSCAQLFIGIPYFIRKDKFI